MDIEMGKSIYSIPFDMGDEVRDVASGIAGKLVAVTLRMGETAIGHVLLKDATRPDYTEGVGIGRLVKVERQKRAKVVTVTPRPSRTKKAAA